MYQAAHEKNLKNYLTHVDSTSLDMIKSKKIPIDNTTGVKGVYHIRGKYIAKIVFQKTAYYLGTFDDIEEAKRARHDAEVLLFNGTIEFYRKWEQRASSDHDWAVKHPIQIHVEKDHDKGLQVRYLPEL